MNAASFIHFVPQLSEVTSYVTPGSGICGTIFFLFLRGDIIFFKMEIWKKQTDGKMRLVEGHGGERKRKMELGKC